MLQTWQMGTHRLWNGKMVSRFSQEQKQLLSPLKRRSLSPLSNVLLAKNHPLLYIRLHQYNTVLFDSVGDYIQCGSTDVTDKSKPWRIWASPPKGLLKSHPPVVRQPPLASPFSFSLSFTQASSATLPSPAGPAPLELAQSCSSSLLNRHCRGACFLWLPLWATAQGICQLCTHQPASLWPPWLPRGQNLAPEVPYTRPGQRAEWVAADPTAARLWGSQRGLS